MVCSNGPIDLDFLPDSVDDICQSFFHYYLKSNRSGAKRRFAPHKTGMPVSLAVAEEEVVVVPPATACSGDS